MLLHIPNDTDSDPSSSYSSSLYSSDSSDSRYYKRRQRTHNKCQSKRRNKNLIKNCAKLTTKLLKAFHNYKVMRFKLDEDPLQQRVYFLNLIKSLKMVLSQFKQTLMLLMDYPSLRGENFPNYNKQSNLNLLHVYIDARIQRLIYEYPGYGLQAITRLQSQFSNMTFSDKSRLNRMFQHK